MAANFFYLIPPQTHGRLDGESRWRYWRRLLSRRHRQLPSGGVRILYRHCEMLRRHGLNGWPVHLGNFTVDWFEHDLEVLSLPQALARLQPEDAVVCPEVIPASVAPFRGCASRIVFVQNGALVRRGLAPGQRFEDLGFTGLLACSTWLRDSLRAESALPCSVVTNGIDLSLFKPAPARRQPGRVLYLNRRNVADARAAIAQLPAAVRDAASFHELPNAHSQAEMVAFYQQADLFMAIGYPEGFALPPLEAMACGCAVLGFTGGGGSVHMLDNLTALVAPDGDRAALAACLERLLQDSPLRERLRAQGLAKAAEFGLDTMERELLTFATHAS